MYGKIEIDGSIQELVTSAYKKRGSFITDQSKFGKLILSYLGNHSKKNSREDIHAHYDIGNEFYQMWLDSTMTYSCAYFESENMNLEEAQIAKVHHILKKLDTKPGKRLLDIGCGWGNVIFTAAQKYGLYTVGITLSEEQYLYINKKIEILGLQNKVKVFMLDYRDLGEKDFDYIISVGMFEHVGKDNLGLYFSKIYDYLKTNGRALIHGITGQHQGAGVDPFIVKYIFPGGYIPNISENINHIMNAKLQLDDLEPLRRHYQKTLEIWNTNYQSVFNEVEKKWAFLLLECGAFTFNPAQQVLSLEILILFNIY